MIIGILVISNISNYSCIEFLLKGIYSNIYLTLLRLFASIYS